MDWNLLTAVLTGGILVISGFVNCALLDMDFSMETMWITSVIFLVVGMIIVGFGVPWWLVSTVSLLGLFALGMIASWLMKLFDVVKEKLRKKP